MPVQFVKGVGGKVLSGTVEFAILDWTFTKTSTLVETTNSGSGGFEEFMPTKTGGAGSFNALWDLNNQPDGDSSGGASGALEVGSLVTLKLYVGDSGKFYSIPARIESLAVTVNAVADVVKFACTFKSSGAITDPVAG